MRRLAFAGAVLTALGSVGCSPPDNSNQGTETVAAAPADHLTCAAMISAADKLMNSGAVPRDPALLRDGLVGMMTHVNAHAIPRGLSEKEAFATVERERERLLDELPPARIVDQAKACIEQAKSLR